MAEDSNSRGDRGHGDRSRSGQRRDERSTRPYSRPSSGDDRVRPRAGGARGQGGQGGPRREDRDSSWSQRPRRYEDSAAPRRGRDDDRPRHSRTGDRPDDRGRRDDRPWEKRDRKDFRSRDDRGSRPREDRGARPREDREFRPREDRDGGRPDSRARRDDRPWEKRDRKDFRSRDDRARRDDRPRGDDRPRREGQRNARPGQEVRADRPIEPRVPEGITGRELDKDVQAELRGLSKETAERVARHMVAAQLLEVSDNETAQAHARFAARLGGRVGAVREVHGIIAYRAGDFRTASRELRTSMRITGRTDVLPMIADSERGLGRPERALDIASSEDASDLGVDAAIELIIVVAGAYADTGDIETALRTLEIPALRHKVDGRWQVRLWVAYADLLERAGRPEESKRWIALAADADTEGLTDAAERLGRPAPQPQEEPAWADDEEISVLDAYDPDADADEHAGADEDGEQADGASGDPDEQADVASEAIAQRDESTPTQDEQVAEAPAADVAPAQQMRPESDELSEELRESEESA